MTKELEKMILDAYEFSVNNEPFSVFQIRLAKKILKDYVRKDSIKFDVNKILEAMKKSIVYCNCPMCNECRPSLAKAISKATGELIVNKP